MTTNMRFSITAEDPGSVAFARFARSVEGASGAVDRNSAALKAQAKTADVSARATLSMVKADQLLADAERVLSGEAEETARQLRQQGRAAEESAAKTKLAGDAAKGASAGFGGLGPGMGAVIAGGVALAPVAVTLGLGLGGLGLAALQTTKRADEMRAIFGPLKAEVKDFQASLQPQVVTLFGTSAGIAASALKSLQPVAAATGTALDGVLKQVGAEFKSGEWQRFFSWMAQQAGPDMQLVGNLFVDLAKDMPPLLEQLQPAGRLVLILADDALKVVGALERFHLVLPVLGAAIGFMVGGPIGALVGGLAGVAIQAAATSTEITKTGQAIRQLGELKPVTKQMVDFAGVAGIVAANMSSSAVAVTDVQNAMIDLHPKLGTVRGDMDLLNISVTSGNVVVKAYSDLWDTFVGKSVSYQEAVLSLKQAFEGYNSAVKTSGRTSTAAQLSFLSIFDTMKTHLGTLHQQGASVQQLNSYYQAAIGTLSTLHNLTPAQRGDVQGLTRDYIAWASTIHGLTPQLVTAAGALRDTFLAQVANGRQLVPQAAGDITALADAVLKTGQRSAATAADRAVLIADLRRSGLTAQAAAGLVTDFQRQINGLQGKTVDVNLAASGSGQIVISGTGIGTRFIDTRTGHVGVGHAASAGWYVTGGVPGVDSVPVLAQRDELIVPPHLVRAGAVDHLRGRIPGFAAGGVVGRVSAAETAVGTTQAQWGQLAAQAFALAAVKAQQAALAAMGGFPGGGSSGPGAAAAQRYAASVLPLYGWDPQYQMPPLISLWNGESGWRWNALNASSGAYGIPQSLPASKMAAAGADWRTNPATQIRWGLGYIKQVYGSPASTYAAWLARSPHWYDQGGVLPPGITMAVNGTGRDEYVSRTPGGHGGGDTYVTNNVTVTAPPGTHPAQLGKEIARYLSEYERINGSGWRG